MLAGVIPFCISLAIVAILWLMPLLTRSDLYFSVTVLPSFRNEPKAREILDRYRVELALISIPILALSAAHIFGLQSGLTRHVRLVQLGVSFLVFYRARQKVQPFAAQPTSIREADSHAREHRSFATLLLASGPFLFIAGCAVFLWEHWAEIPTQFALHFAANGMPDRWGVRTLSTVYFPLLNAAGTLSILTFILYGITYWARRINRSGVASERELRFRRTIFFIVLVFEYLVALQSSWIALSPLLRNAGDDMSGQMLFGLTPLLVVLVGAVLLVRLGQGGSRAESINQPYPNLQPIGDRTEDRYWRLGVLYFNRRDPAVFVEKRFGLGYTINFGNPITWCFALLFLLLGLAPLAMTKLH